MTTLREGIQNTLSRPERTLAYLALIVLLVVGSMSTWKTRAISARSVDVLSTANETMLQVKATATTVNAYTAEQAKVYNSKENRDMLRGLRDITATLLLATRKVNMQLLPDIDAEIKAIQVPLDKFTVSIDSLHDLVQHTDSSLNDKEAGIIPALSDTVVKSQAIMQDIDTLIKNLSEKSGIDLTDIHNILADPSWKDSQQEVLDLLRHINAIATNVEKASDAAPQIAKDLESISKKSNRLATPLLIARIASLLAWLIPSLQ